MSDVSAEGSVGVRNDCGRITYRNGSERWSMGGCRREEFSVGVKIVCGRNTYKGPK